MEPSGFWIVTEPVANPEPELEKPPPYPPVIPPPPLANEPPPINPGLFPWFAVAVPDLSLEKVTVPSGWTTALPFGPDELKE